MPSERDMSQGLHFILSSQKRKKKNRQTAIVIMTEKLTAATPSSEEEQTIEEAAPRHHRPTECQTRLWQHGHTAQIQELTIIAPSEVGYLFSYSKGKTARHVRLMKSFYGLTFSAPCVVVRHHTETFSAWMETHVD